MVVWHKGVCLSKVKNKMVTVILQKSYCSQATAGFLF